MTAQPELAREATPAEASRSVLSRVPGWVPPLLVALVAFLSVGLHVHSYTLVGPIDELQHIDYLYKSPSLVAPGDTFGDEAMQEEACRGLDFQPFPLPACEIGGDYTPRDFQENGYNTASANTPLYYSVTHLVALPIMALTPVDNLVTAGRLVGGLWLAAGLLVAYAAGRRMGAGRWALAAVLGTLACLPAIVYPSSTITPDAATFLVGAGVLLAALWWEEKPGRRWPLLAVVTTLALCIKMTNVVVVVAVGVYMLLRLTIRWWLARRARLADEAAPEVPAEVLADPADPGAGVPVRSWLIGGATLAATAVVIAGAWIVLQGALQHGDPNDIPMNQRFAAASLSLSGMFSALGSWLTPLSSPWTAVGRPELTDVLQRLGTLLLSAGLIGAAVLGLRPLRERTFAWATVITATAGASFFILLSFYAQGVYVPPPPRYGASLAPVMAVLTAIGLRTKPAVAAGCALAAAAVVMSVLRLA